MGFEPARGQNLAFAIDIRDQRPELQRLSMLADKVRKKGKVTVRPANFDRWDEEVG